MITKIEIELPIAMDVPDIVFQEIDRLLTEYVCKPYKQANPDKTMWVSSHGAKMQCSYIDSIFLGKREWDETIPNGQEPTFDDSIYSIGISERAKL